MGIKEDDLIKYLDAFMSGDGGSIKPMVDEDGNFTFITAQENVASKAANDKKIFTDDVDDDCPSCANIPNLGDSFDDEW